MTKSDITYASVPTTSDEENTTTPSASSATSPTLVQGFALGPTHAVTVIVDETPSPYTASENPTHFLQGTRYPVQLSQCPHCQKANIQTTTRTYPTAVT